MASCISLAQTSETPQDEPTAVVHGQVLSTVDGMPIPHALVSLSQPQRSVLTDEQGRFEFTGARYGAVITAEKPDLLCDAPISGPRPVCVVSLDEFSPELHVILRLTPQAVVTGRVVDQNGAPIPGLELKLIAAGTEVQRGRNVRHIGAAAQTQTNSDGTYRITRLTPGTYLLRTASTPESDDGRADHGYAATYFPGTTDFNSAKPIVLAGGEQCTANLTIPLIPFQPVTLSYIWDRPEAGSSVGFGLASAIGDNHLSTQLDMERRTFFTFAPPGDYTLHLFIDPPYDPHVTGRPRWSDGSSDRYLASVNFSVQNSPVHITDIRLQQPTAIPLHVRSQINHRVQREAAATPERPYYAPYATFQLSDDENDSNDEVKWSIDRGPSEFVLKAPPGKYELTSFVGGDAYTAALTCGKVNLLREPLIITPDSPPCSVDALISDNVASISVGLTARAKEQLTKAGIEVTSFALFPLENTMETPYSGFAWANSAPRTWNIEPGTYIAILFDGRSIAWLDPETRKRLMQVGTTITLAPNQARTVLLDWLPEFNNPQKGPISVSLGRVLP